MSMQCAGELWDILGLIQAAERNFDASARLFEVCLLLVFGKFFFYGFFLSGGFESQNSLLWCNDSGCCNFVFSFRRFGGVFLFPFLCISKMEKVSLLKKQDLDGAQEAFSKAKAICASITHGEKSRFFRAILGVNEVCLSAISLVLAFVNFVAKSVVCCEPEMFLLWTRLQRACCIWPSFLTLSRPCVTVLESWCILKTFLSFRRRCLPVSSMWSSFHRKFSICCMELE